VEPTSGRIVIDGVNISSIGLHDIISKVSIIQQDPTTLGSTMRNNIDPLEDYSDYEIHKVCSSSYPTLYIHNCINFTANYSFPEKYQYCLRGS